MCVLHFIFDREMFSSELSVASLIYPTGILLVPCDRMSDPKKGVQYKNEILELICRWSNCGVVFSRGIETFSQHVASHAHGKETFFCEWADCGATFSGSTQLSKHLSFHAHHERLLARGRNVASERSLPACEKRKLPFARDPDIPLQCQWEDCDVIFNDVLTFYAHVEWHATLGPCGDKTEEMPKCGWKGCAMALKTAGKLRDHARMHTEERLLACPDCEMTFTYRSKLIDHLHRQNNGDGQFQCTHCLKSFSTQRILRDHVRRHVNYYRCNVCGMTMSSPAAIANHHLYRHQDDRPFKCEFEGCQYAGKREYDFKRHLETHKTIRDLPCPQEGCDAVFRSKDRLNAHVKKKHAGGDQRKYLCHLCGGKWVRATTLTKHLRKQHKVNVPEYFKRYSYAKGADGYYRMQLVRLEAVDVIDGVEPQEVAFLGGETMECVEDDLAEVEEDEAGDEFDMSESGATSDGMQYAMLQAKIEEDLEEVDASTEYDGDEEGILKIIEDPEGENNNFSDIDTMDSFDMTSNSATIGCHSRATEFDSTSEFDSSITPSLHVQDDLDEEDFEAYVENGEITVIHKRPLRPDEGVAIQVEDVHGLGKRAKVRIISMQ